MTLRRATCRCGQLVAECSGEPFRVSVCHCTECQKRSGSAFAVQARWTEDQIALTGDWKLWERQTDSGGRVRYRFCPECGSTLHYTIDAWPGVAAVPVGAFADPQFPAPGFSIYEARKHGWVEVTGEAVEHLD